MVSIEEIWNESKSAVYRIVPTFIIFFIALNIFNSVFGSGQQMLTSGLSVVVAALGLGIVHYILEVFKL